MSSASGVTDDDRAARTNGPRAGEKAGPDVVIEDVTTPARLKEIEEVQRLVWGMDERGIVPASLLQIAATSGGIVLAAYDRSGHSVRARDDDRAIGFVFGLLARREGRLYHASHMLATDPAYQGRGVGAALKLAQRDRALAQGLDLITWTFDPLIARNAHFNLRKLGAISRAYCEDYYGPMEDRYNSGLPTDRLLVEWRLREAIRRPLPELAAPPTPLLDADEGQPALRLERVEAVGGRVPLSVRIPSDMTSIKEADLAAALAWRLAVRQALSWAFAQGYVACDFADGAYVLVPDDATGADAALITGRDGPQEPGGKSVFPLAPRSDQGHRGAAVSDRQQPRRHQRLGWPARHLRDRDHDRVARRAGCFAYGTAYVRATSVVPRSVEIVVLVLAETVVLVPHGLCRGY